jgi:hypothetical protein
MSTRSDEVCEVSKKRRVGDNENESDKRLLINFELSETLSRHQAGSHSVVQMIDNSISHDHDLNSPFEISNKIVKPKDSNHNLCLYYAIFNALRDPIQRRCFAGDVSTKEPADTFVHVIKNIKPGFHERALDIGYNEDDMRFYLAWLRDNKIIKGFRWLRQKSWKLSQMTHLNHGHKEPKILILFGDCIKSDFKPKVVKMVEAALKTSKNKHIAGLKAIEAIEKFSNSYKGKWGHGIALSMESDLRLYLYDTSNMIRHEFSFRKYCTLLTHVNYVYKIEIDV